MAMVDPEGCSKINTLQILTIFLIGLATGRLVDPGTGGKETICFLFCVSHVIMGPVLTL